LADLCGRFTHIMVTRHLQAERTTGSVHRPKTGVLPTMLSYSCHLPQKSIEFISHKNIADLVPHSADNLARHQSWSVCSGRVDRDLTRLICSCNVCIPHYGYTSCHSVQLPELLAFFRTFRHSMSEDPSHIELLHRKVVSSVSLSADELQFPPTSLSLATQLPPKCVLAALPCSAMNNASAMIKVMCRDGIYEIFPVTECDLQPSNRSMTSIFDSQLLPTTVSTSWRTLVV